MAKEAGKKSLLDFFKGKDIDDEYDEFDDDLFDDDEDEDDDYDDYDDDDDEDYAPRRSQKTASRQSSNTRQFTSKSAAQTRPSASSGAVRPQTRTGTGSGKLVEFNGRRGIKSNMNGEVYVIQPKDIEDTDTIVDNLLDGYVIIINLEGVEVSTGQRIVDFVGGATKAIDGTIVPVTGNIFVATAHKDSVTGDIREELAGAVSNQIGFNY